MRATELLNKNPYVKGASPNIHLGLADTTPNDPLYNPIDDTPQWGLMKIEATEAWDYITGSDMTDGSELDDYVKVAVIDTGVDAQHPDLVNNLDMSLAYDAYSNANNITPGDTTDTHGHGTHVAGIIGAEGNNQICVSGVCWHVEMVPIKITPGASGVSSPEAIAEALDYAAYNELLIANMSFSLGYSRNSLIEQAIADYSSDGGLLVLAAGNKNRDIDDYPIYIEVDKVPGVIIVGALKYDLTNDDKATFSNYGDTVVDLFAPGEAIISTYPTTINDEGYEYLSGTSMAAPFVTGVAALIKSANTAYFNATIKDVILDNVTTSSNLTNYCSTGGRLNIPDALYDMGNRVIISDTMTHGTVRPSAIFSKPNTIIYLTAYPDAGYMLKPGSMKHNSNNTITINKWRSFCAMLYVDEVITAQFYMVGDIDFDEAITVADALAALRHYAGTGVLTGDAFLAADVDGDGDVDYDDVQAIQAFAAHMIDHFPIEE